MTSSSALSAGRRYDWSESRVNDTSTVGPEEKRTTPEIGVPPVGVDPMFSSSTTASSVCDQSWHLFASPAARNKASAGCPAVVVAATEPESSRRDASTPSAATKSLDELSSGLCRKRALPSGVGQVEDHLRQQRSTLICKADVVSAFDGIGPLLHLLSTESGGLEAPQNFEHVRWLKGHELFLAVPGDCGELARTLSRGRTSSTRD